MTEVTRAAIRTIERLGVETPLLVPSFSGRGFPSLKSIFHSLRLDLFGTCLVSAFDVDAERIEVDFARAAQVLFLDSGVYETDPSMVESGGQAALPAASTWTRAAFHALLRGIPASANVVPVSFDSYADLGTQIEGAMEDFSLVPTAPGDFLMKPPVRGDYLDVKRLVPHLDQIREFPVIGVTEAELGGSAGARCRALVALRDLLTRAGSRAPVHVFGVITPGSTLAYFLSGADIFDGINWLRFDYTRPFLGSLAESIIEDVSAWHAPEEEMIERRRRANLLALRRLQEAMRTYAKTLDDALLRSLLPASLTEAAFGLANSSSRWFRSLEVNQS